MAKYLKKLKCHNNQGTASKSKVSSMWQDQKLQHDNVAEPEVSLC